MKYFSLFISTVLLASALVSYEALAWGERGHHIVGYTAARLVKSKTRKGDANEKAMGQFFSDRAIALGHLSNIPDISWKTPSQDAAVRTLNPPHHFFDVERVLKPGERMTSLPTDIELIVKRYADLGHDMKKFREGIGFAPWRIQELFGLLREAFQCIKNKEAQAPEAKGSAFVSPFDPGKTPTYSCKPEVPKRSDVFAAMSIAGVLSHFIGDLAQPYHVTVDYDGWDTGNGGVHAYFESEVLHELDERMSAEVLEKSKYVGFEVFPSTRESLVKLAYRITENSYKYIPEVRRLDSKLLASPSSVQNSTKVSAVRRPKDDPSVQKAFRNITVKRLAFGASTLAKIWMMAWVEGGKPKMDGYPIWLSPYPLDVPFIFPSFEPIIKQ